MKSHLFRSILVLVLCYVSLISPMSHMHHSHNDDISGLELSEHPFEVDVTDESEHHHHDTNRSHAEDHQHQYDAQINWHIARLQSQKTVLNANEFLYSSVSILQDDECKISYITYKEPPKLDTFENSTLIVRGPPQLA